MGHSITHLLDSLGWALLHSLWQGGLAFIVVVIMRSIFKNNTPSLRYAAQLSVLVACFAAFLTTFGIYFKAGLQSGGESLGLQAGTGAIPLADLTAPISQTLSNGISAVQSSLTADAASLTPLIGIFWCLGFALMALRYAGAFMLTQRLRSRGLSDPSPAWTNRFRTLVLNAGLPAGIQLHISNDVTGPVTLGFIKPIVLVPVGFLTGLPQDQVEAILLHEIAHIRRYDYALNLVQTAIKTVFFFHPAIHYISRRIDIDREQACDDLAVAQSRNPRALAKGLAYLRLQSCAHGLAMNAIGDGTDTPLMDRLARLAGYSETSHRSEHMIISAVTALLIGSLYVASAGSANAHPESPETKKSYEHANAALKNYSFKSARLNGRDVVLKISEDGRRWINVGGAWHDVDKNPTVINNIEMGLPTLPKAPKFNNIDLAGSLDNKHFNKVISKDAKALAQFQIDMEYYERSLENYAENSAANDDVIDRLEDKADRLADRVEDKFEDRQDQIEAMFERHVEAELRKEVVQHRREGAQQRKEEAIERAHEANERAQERAHEAQERANEWQDKNDFTILQGRLYVQLLNDEMIRSTRDKLTMKFANETWTANGVAVPAETESKYCSIFSDMGIDKSKLTKMVVLPNSVHIESQSKDGKSQHTQRITYGEYDHSHDGLRNTKTHTKTHTKTNTHTKTSTKAHTKNHTKLNMARPSMPPVAPVPPVPAFIVPTTSFKVNVKFGMTDPAWRQKHSHAHRGIDLGATTGTPVYASSDGEVSFIADEPSWGNRVILKHADGYQTLYAHLDNFTVTHGQSVSAGQVIGTVGSTGESPGPHLHFEIRKDGTPIDLHL